MMVKRGIRCKCLAAHRAAVRSISRMRSHVFFQGIGALEKNMTIVTFVELLCVMSSHVFLEVTPQGNLAMTNETFIWQLLGMGEYMRPQTGSIDERPFAHVAFVRSNA